MSGQQGAVRNPVVVPTLWSTVAFNLFAVFVTVAVVGLDDTAGWALWLPVVSLGLSGAAGVGSLLSRRTRRFGAGCLAGTLASALLYVVLFAIFFVTYFLVPGGHELS
jgi:hypothetical protein